MSVPLGSCTWINSHIVIMNGNSEMGGVLNVQHCGNEHSFSTEWYPFCTCCTVLTHEYSLYLAYITISMLANWVMCNAVERKKLKEIKIKNKISRNKPCVPYVSCSFWQQSRGTQHTCNFHFNCKE